MVVQAHVRHLLQLGLGAERDAEARGLFEQARRALDKDGRIVTVDPCFAARQSPVARFLIARDRGRNVRDADGYRALPQPYFDRIDGQLRHRTWIPYTHWIMECRAQA